MKTKLLICAFAFSVLCCGCVSHINEEEEEGHEKTILFTTSMNVSQSPMRSLSGDVSRIVVADYQDGVEKQKVEQTSTDANFGKMSLPLKFGEHELLFVGHNSETGTMTYPNIHFEKPMDTFSYYLSLSVDEKTSSSQKISLSRSVAMLKVVAEDAIPAEISSLKITMSTYYPSLNVRTSFSNGNAESVERTFQYKLSHVGVKGSTYSIYTFSPENGFKTDVLISTIDTDGKVVNTITMKDIPIEKNRQTILSGNIFQLNSTIELEVNTQWGDNIEYPI